MSVIIERTIQIPEWNEFLKFKAIDFWTRRRFKFNETEGYTLTAKRGNLLGNLISFDMSKLTSKLTINISPDKEIHCVLAVNTFMQIVTDYNRAWWDLEMKMFESFLLQSDEQDERWEKFKGNYKNAAIAWTLSSGIVGNKIPPEEKPC